MEEKWSDIERLDYGLEAAKQGFAVISERIGEMAKVWAIVSRRRIALVIHFLIQCRCEQMLR